MIGDDNVENAVDGVNDEDGLPRETNEGGSDWYTRHEHRMAQALENNNTEFAVGNDFDVDNLEDTIDALVPWYVRPGSEVVPGERYCASIQMYIGLVLYHIYQN